MILRICPRVRTRAHGSPAGITRSSTTWPTAPPADLALMGGRYHGPHLREPIGSVSVSPAQCHHCTGRGGGMTDILVQHDGPIATVVINRPAMRNAISYAMWTELARVTEELGKTDAVRAVVYRGAGTVAFASGADISEFKEQRKDAASAARYNAATGAAYSTIRECPKPTVAMIFGFCMGGAMAVAMACDMRFAAEGSKFGIPAARLSIIYGADSVGQLVDLVGPAYAKDILYSARTIEDREALAMGFIQRLLPAA